jgi:RNA polymerase sigma factor (sigma-70 family)
VLLRVASDERLVEMVRGGSEPAFEAIYDRHHRGILAFCRHMLSSADEAEDALQHTFMAGYRHLVGGDADIQLRPWLYTIARNRCLSLLRARRERPLGVQDEPVTEHLSSEAQRRQDVRDLLADVAGLPEEQRAALVLAELGSVSHTEIAEILGVPRPKVKALVFQARTSLIASRKGRETPCAEIREQLANLRGGALRRTTLRRHLRECAGCRAFRDDVALQRKTLAVALPVLPTLGLKEAALGAAFGSSAAGGGAAAAGGGALAAKALVAVALVGGGTTVTVEVAHRATAPEPAPPAERSAPAKAVAPALPPAATPVVQRAEAREQATVHRAQARGREKAAAHREREHAARGHRHGRGHGAKPEHAAREHVPPGQAKPKAIPPGHAKKAPAAPVVKQPKPKPAKPPQAKAKGNAKRLAAEPTPSAAAPAAPAPRGRAKVEALTEGKAKGHSK